MNSISKARFVVESVILGTIFLLVYTGLFLSAIKGTDSGEGLWILGAFIFFVGLILIIPVVLLSFLAQMIFVYELVAYRSKKNQRIGLGYFSRYALILLFIHINIGVFLLLFSIFYGSDNKQITFASIGLYLVFGAVPFYVLSRLFKAKTDALPITSVEQLYHPDFFLVTLYKFFFTHRYKVFFIPLVIFFLSLLANYLIGYSLLDRVGLLVVLIGNGISLILAPQTLIESVRTKSFKIIFRSVLSVLLGCSFAVFLTLEVVLDDKIYPREVYMQEVEITGFNWSEKQGIPVGTYTFTEIAPSADTSGAVPIPVWAHSLILSTDGMFTYQVDGHMAMIQATGDVQIEGDRLVFVVRDNPITSSGQEPFPKFNYGSVLFIGRYNTEYDLFSIEWEEAQPNTLQYEEGAAFLRD